MPIMLTKLTLELENEMQKKVNFKITLISKK